MIKACSPRKTSYFVFLCSIVLSFCTAPVLAQRVGVANNPIQLEPRSAINNIKLPDGFKISLYAIGVENARSLALSDSGTLFVGTRQSDKVYAVVDTDNDNTADTTYIIAEGLNTPNGVALKDGDLYVAEINRILRFDDIENHLNNPPEPVVITDSYPTESHHGWKYIAFGPDGKLYIPVGAPCNTCERAEIYASITRMNADGSGREIFAHGIRNTVGFDWHPQTEELWFTDNGRDMWGDDRPPEELNRAPEAGLHFGFPYRFGKDLVDTDYESPAQGIDFAAPELELPAHTAGLGMEFYTGDSFPSEYKNDLFIAYHGSWNRSKPTGYYLMHVEIEGNKAVNASIFASGWLQDDKYWGRPVDLEAMPDGSLLLSDDHAGVIYRISYEK